VIEGLTINKIKEMIWQEVIVAKFDDRKPADSEMIVKELADFIVRHRLCAEDVNQAMISLQSEYRRLPCGTILGAGGEKVNQELGDEYEAMRISGSLQCVK
jgi:hypothetical protein